MAYGKRQLQPPAFPAAAGPTPATQGPAQRGPRLERGPVRDMFVPTEESLRARMTFALVVMVLSLVALAAELGSQPSTAWIGIPGVLLALAVGGLALRRAIRDRRHLRASSTAPGTVTGAVHAGALNPSVRPTIGFTSADGQVHEFPATFPERALHEGRQVTVRYDETDPSWVVIDGDDFRASVRMVRLVAALTGPAALALVVALARLAS